MRRLILLLMVASLAVSCASYGTSSSDSEGTKKRDDDSHRKSDGY